jgi:hypothetical protein
MAKVEDLIGREFGFWTVIKKVPNKTKSKSSCWKCRCICGQIKDVIYSNLANGHSKSCGCLGRNTKHGKSKSPLYGIWLSMKKRCFNQNCKSYKNYGGRGITVCDRWKDSFENFYNDMMQTWQKGLSLDRIDNDSNYEPENCRWVTNKEQANNRRTNKVVEYQGRSQTLTQWAEELNLSPSLLHERYREGITGKDLWKPSRRKKNN